MPAPADPPRTSSAAPAIPTALPGRPTSRAVDAVLLLVAGWLLLGPRGPLRLEAEAWLEARRRTARVEARWDALTGRGAGLGAAADDASVVLVEFTDYRCPFCATAAAEIEAALAAAPGARVVVRHLPLEVLHPDAPLLARVSVCAEADPAWPEVHARLFAAPDESGSGAPADRRLAGLLARAGAADPEAVLRCARGEAAARRVAADGALARDLGIVGTPTFVAPGLVMEGALSRERLREILGPSRP